MTDIKKGDTVYHRMTPDSWNWENEGGKPLRVMMIRKGAERGRYRNPDLYFVCSADAPTTNRRKWSSEGIGSIIHADDLTPEQAATFATLRANRVRKAYEAKESESRAQAQEAAFRQANADKLASVEVGPVEWTPRLYNGRITGGSVGATVTTYRVTGKGSGCAIEPRTDFVGVSIDTQSGTWDGDSYRREWGVGMSGYTRSLRDARITAEALAMALDIIPTLSDPNERDNA